MADRAEQWAAGERRVGRTIGSKFRLLRLLGVGGMAAVYEASHRNGKRVALKLLHPSLGASERERKRFLREAYIANTIGHPGVVPVFDDGIEGDETFLVMELLEGQTVAALQERSGGKLEPAIALRIVDGLLDVLAAAHARGAVHRDIKPENLFLETNGGLRVLDFGIARFEHVPGSTVDTQAGAMLGTPAFMSQEQARGRWDEVDERSDLWSAGATLFTMLSGQPVHACETFNEQLGRAMTTPARSLASAVTDAPPALAELVDRALRFERSERFQSARSMQEAVRGLGLVDFAALPALPANALMSWPPEPPEPSDGARTQPASFGGIAPALRGAASFADSRAFADGRGPHVLLARPAALFALAAVVLLALFVALRVVPPPPLAASHRTQSAGTAVAASSPAQVPARATLLVQQQPAAIETRASLLPAAPDRATATPSRVAAKRRAERPAKEAPRTPDLLDLRY
jgi:serine/threonine-protein kinase